MQLLQIPVILFALLSILTQSSCALQSDEHGIDSMSPRDGAVRSGSHHTNAVIKDISDQADAKSMAMAQAVPYLDVLSKVPIYRDNHVELLIDGPATLTSMMRAIQAAEHYIYLETYIFESSEEGRLFAEALAEKSRQGIVVNVIYDSVGSMASDVKMFEMMDASGVSLIEYHPVDPTEGGNPLGINNRNHRKLLVVDGLIGFTGGVNLSSAYGSGSKPGRRRDPIREGWRDTHIAVKGPVVQGFEQEFLNHWRSQGGQVAVPQKPVLRPAVGDAVVAIVSSEGGDAQGSEITLRDWKRRPLWQRITERLSWVIEYWL